MSRPPSVASIRDKLLPFIDQAPYRFSREQVKHGRFFSRHDATRDMLGPDGRPMIDPMTGRPEQENQYNYYLERAFLNRNATDKPINYFRRGLGLGSVTNVHVAYEPKLLLKEGSVYRSTLDQYDDVYVITQIAFDPGMSQMIFMDIKVLTDNDKVYRLNIPYAGVRAYIADPGRTFDDLLPFARAKKYMETMELLYVDFDPGDCDNANILKFMKDGRAVRGQQKFDANELGKNVLLNFKNGLGNVDLSNYYNVIFTPDVRRQRLSLEARSKPHGTTPSTSAGNLTLYKNDRIEVMLRHMGGIPNYTSLPDPVNPGIGLIPVQCKIMNIDADRITIRPVKINGAAPTGVHANPLPVEYDGNYLFWKRIARKGILKSARLVQGGYTSRMRRRTSRKPH